jgi:hypothetical protein
MDGAGAEILLPVAKRHEESSALETAANINHPRGQN